MVARGGRQKAGRGARGEATFRVMASWAERYEAGQERYVWAELVALGPEVFEPRHRPDAEKVADLTMARAAGNVATLVVRLTLMGYRFGARFHHNRKRRTIEDLGLRDSLAAAGRDVSWVDAGAVVEEVMGWVPPSLRVEPEIDHAERLLGPLPLTIPALMRWVDAVDLTGSFPSWNPSAFDFDEGDEGIAFGRYSGALHLSGIATINENFQPSKEMLIPGAVLPARSFALPLGPDHRLSANREGDYHHILVPDAVADPILLGVDHRPDIRLVEYLRTCFEWGGFPGFALADEVPPEIAVLRRGLRPI